MSDKKPEAVKATRKLGAMALQPAEVRRTEYVATIPAGHALTDVLDPIYWAHVSEKLRVLFKICCWWEDGTRYAELLVIRVAHTEVQCTVLIDKPLDTSISAADIAKNLENYEVGYAGPDVGYRVVRKVDRHVMRSDINWTQERAMAWLFEHLSQPASGRAAAPQAPRAADAANAQAGKDLANEPKTVKAPAAKKAA